MFFCLVAGELLIRAVDFFLEGNAATRANLTGADLTGAKGLTYNQLASVKSLYKTQGLETVLKTEEITRLTAEKEELFNLPKEEQNDKISS